jgi:CDP-4-dehydro-6-deoxyglucose reductase/ferredoxin-NAD(P)+ reductase (naphthalene dioxygenase ferredoxin-specific)
VACRVAGLEAVTRDLWILRLGAAAGRRFDFAAGQYARVSVGGLLARAYSIASRPDEAALEFHIRCVPGDEAGDYIARRLALGDPVEAEGPFGDAWLRPGHRGPILAVAGSSGLAPMKSIVETALGTEAGRHIHLYFGVRQEGDLYLTAHFQALAGRHGNLRFVPVLSEPEGPSKYRRGLVGDAVAADFADFPGFKAYLAGPPAMVEAMVALLTARGLDPRDIHADPY